VNYKDPLFPVGVLSSLFLGFLSNKGAAIRANCVLLNAINKKVKIYTSKFIRQQLSIH